MCRITLGNTVLRLAGEDDAPFILRLRLDAALNRFLSAVEPDLAQQVQWLRQYKRREAQGEEFSFYYREPARAELRYRPPLRFSG